MSAVPKRKLTVAEYLAIEREAEFKSEFYDGEMFPVYPDQLIGIAGASRDHNAVKENLIGELFVRLKGGPCRSYSSDQRVKVGATGLYTYPDIVIVCGSRDYDAADPDALLNPAAIIEVLSPSTERYDRGMKFRHYQRIPGLREYVLVSQDRPEIERFVRQPDGTWSLTVFDELAGEFALATVPVRAPMADVYRDVEFPPARLR